MRQDYRDHHGACWRLVMTRSLAKGAAVGRQLLLHFCASAILGDHAPHNKGIASWSYSGRDVSKWEPTMVGESINRG